MKRILCLALIMAMLLTLAVPASAAVKDDTAEPQYNQIYSVKSALSIDSAQGIATCAGVISAKTGYAVRLYIRLQMYKDGDWQLVHSWMASGTAYLSLVKDCAIVSGYQYRTYVIGYVYDADGNLLESASAIHTVNYPAN